MSNNEKSVLLPLYYNRLITGPVKKIVVKNDALYVTDSSNYIKVFDKQTGKLVITIIIPYHSVTSIAVDSRHIYACGGWDWGGILVFDKNTGDYLNIWQTEKSYDFLVTGSNNYLYAITEQSVDTLDIHNTGEIVSTIQVSNVISNVCDDEKYIYCAEKLSVVEVIDKRKMEIIKKYKSPILGRIILSSSINKTIFYENELFHYWDDKKENILKIKSPDLGLGLYGYISSLGSDDQLIYIGTNKSENSYEILVIDYYGKIVNSYPVDHEPCIIIIDEDFIIIGYDNGMITLSNKNTSNIKWTIEGNKNDIWGINRIDFTNDKHYIYVSRGSNVDIYHKKNLKLFRTIDNHDCEDIFQEMSVIKQILVDDSYLYTIYKDNIVIRDVNKFEITTILHCRGIFENNLLMAGLDSDYLYLCSRGGVIKRWSKKQLAIDDSFVYEVLFFRPSKFLVDNEYLYLMEYLGDSLDVYIHEDACYKLTKTSQQT